MSDSNEKRKNFFFIGANLVSSPDACRFEEYQQLLQDKQDGLKVLNEAGPQTQEQVHTGQDIRKLPNIAHETQTGNGYSAWFGFRYNNGVYSIIYSVADENDAAGNANVVKLGDSPTYFNTDAFNVDLT